MRSAFAFCFFVLAASTCSAALRLPAVMSNHAMLQAGKPVAVWGWAEPGAQVKVEFLGDVGQTAQFTAKTDETGKWFGHLAARSAGELGTLRITTDKGDQKIVDDIQVGEVWLGSGQSNMNYIIAGPTYFPDDPGAAEMVVRNIAVAKNEADTAQPPIRYFRVTSSGADQPADDVKGEWVRATSANVGGFSAVAWNFGVALQNHLHVPVGLIVSSVGGIPVEAYMSQEALEATPAGKAVIERNAQALAGVTPEMVAKYHAEEKAWVAANPTAELRLMHASTHPRVIYTPTSGAVPSRLYNGMIRGLEPYTLRGFIWFQADGNMGHPLEYSELFQGLIKNWRADWKEELPFYFVEMNNMREDRQTKPVQENPLSVIREQQHGGLLLPWTGIVGSIDLGTKDPHFPNKKPVGERLAGLALRDCYDSPGLVNSPIYRSFAVEGGKLRLKFSDAEGLRIHGDRELKGFAIRGTKEDWVWADGKIEGQDIVVWSDRIPAPTAVRYAWAMNPVTSVENRAGLPLLPFRTDVPAGR